MASITGLQSGNFTDIDVTYSIAINGDVGQSGQVLSSDGTNTLWINGSSIDREDLTAADTTITISGDGTYDGQVARTIQTNKVPNAITFATDGTGSRTGTFDGSSAITIDNRDNDNQLTLVPQNGIVITNLGGFNRGIATDIDADTIVFNGTEMEVAKVPNDLTFTGYATGTFNGSSGLNINLVDTDTTYQGGTGISIDTATNPDTINASNIPNSALQNSTISGKALGSNLSTITFYNSSGGFITSYNGADPPTSVTLDGDTTYNGGKNITIDTTANPDEIDLDDDLTGIDSLTFTSTSGTTSLTGNNYPSNPTTATYLDLSSTTNTFPNFVGGSEILKSISYIDNTSQNFNRIYNTSFEYFFSGSQDSGSDTLEIDFVATSTTGYCEFGFYANTLTSGMVFMTGIAAATGGTSPFSTSLGSGAVSIDAYKLGLFDGDTSRYSLKEILDFTSFENTYITSKYFFNNLTVGTRYRMALYGRCYNSGSIYINAGGRGTTGLASRSFHQPAFMKFYEYDSSIGGARTTGGGGL